MTHMRCAIIYTVRPTAQFDFLHDKGSQITIMSSLINKRVKSLRTLVSMQLNAIEAITVVFEWQQNCLWIVYGFCILAVNRIILCTVLYSTVVKCIYRVLFFQISVAELDIDSFGSFNKAFGVLKADVD